MLGQVLLSAVLVLGPCIIGENTSLESLLNFSGMNEFEGRTLELKNHLDTCFFDAVLEITILLSVQVEVVLGIVLLLDMLWHLVEVGLEISSIGVDDKSNEELNKLLLTRGDVHLFDGFHIFFLGFLSNIIKVEIQ